MHDAGGVELSKEGKGMSEKAKTELRGDAPVVLEALVGRAVAARASDVHLQTEAGGVRVSFRLDGRMTGAGEYSAELGERVMGRIKYLARLKTYEDALPQDGRIAGSELGVAGDIRVSTYPTVTGEKIVLRLFEVGGVVELVELGLPGGALLEVEDYLVGDTGMLLLTGPAGSGKTTTIYACLRRVLAMGGRHVITVEDPVEQVIPGLMQTEVNEAVGLGFARAARHLLRQDPEVLVLGEIRDEETAALALRAALTGHQVVTTLHAGSCRGVFDRLLLLCGEEYVVYSAVELVLNQRLVRRVCVGCGGRGCGECLGTGFLGRAWGVEHLRMTDGLRARARVEGTGVLVSERPLRVMAGELCRAGVTNELEVGRTLGT
ncbi:MAG: GspE/PulE family protein [Limisphaerales bacterium]